MVKVNVQERMQSENERVAAATDPAQLVEALQVDEPAGGDGSEVEAHVDVGAAGEGDERALVPQQAQGLGERRRLEKGEPAHGGGHHRTLRTRGWGAAREPARARTMPA